MIKLIQILEEIQNPKPKAIFLSGAAGSGKSHFIREYLPSSFTVVNVDDEYEKLLKSSGLGTKIKDFNANQLSKAAEMMGQARKVSKEKYQEVTTSLKDVIVDGTGGASKPLLKKKQELENLGYETFMLMIYVSPLVSLERNKNRDRSLLPQIITRTWRDVNRNIQIFREAFGENFVLINNNPEGADEDFDIKSLQPYLDNAKAKGKPKTPEQIQKSKEEKDKINQEIKDMLKNRPEFDSVDFLKNKLNKWAK